MFETGFIGTARLDLIGRETEKQLIDTAMHQKGKLRVVYLRGSGGIGKSSLLAHVAAHFTSAPRSDFVYSGIIDLYDHDSYSSTGLEKIILNGLKTDLERMRQGDLPRPQMYTIENLLSMLNDYQRRSNELREKQLALPGHGQGAVVEKLRVALSQQFLRTFSAIEQNFRVVLCFDTIELLEHQVDNAQLKLGLESENITGRNWLLQTIARMQNSLVILAGRPETALSEDLRVDVALRNTLDGVNGEKVADILKVVTLSGLNSQEVSIYLYQARPEFYEEAAELDPNSPYMQNVTRLTGGKPIMLGWFAELCGQKPWIDIGAVRDEELPALIQRFEQAIIADVQRGRGLDLDEWEARSIIEYMVLARKGIQGDMLAFLLQRTSHNHKDYTPELCEDYLRKLRSLSFIKTREVKQLFFLHDEIYRILSSRPETRHSRYVYQLLVEYQKEQIDRLQSEVAAVAQVPEWYHDPLLLERYIEMERQIQTRILERLHYHVCADVRGGYDEYCRQTDISINNSQFEHDERLRDEFLRVMSDGEGWRYQVLAEQGVPPTLVERDEALRWLKRLSGRGRSQSDWIVRQLQRIRQLTTQLDGLEDPLFQANALLLLWDNSILASRNSTEIIQQLETAVSTLKEWAGQEAIEYPPLGSYQRISYTAWLYDSTMGRMLNNLGYTYRLQRRLIRAEQCYREALPYLNRAARMETQLADTLNNLAFVYRLQGRLTEANILCRDALRQREREGHSYPIALGHNTLGLIYLSLERYEAAERECMQARRLMERTVGRTDNRGVGLVYTALGKILRHRGRRLHEPQLLKESIDYLQSSANIFDTLGEPASQVEAYNELGCAYRALGLVRVTLGDKEVEEVYQRAIQYLEFALSLTTNEMQLERADCYEDMAEVCFHQGDDARSFYYLEMSDKIIDPSYHYVDGQIPQRGDDAIPEGMYCLGKNEMLRGDLTLRHYLVERDEERLEVAIENFVRSVGYFEFFPNQSDLPRVALAKLYYRLGELIRQPGDWNRHQQDRVSISRHLNHYRQIYNLEDSPTLKQLLQLLGH
jgi:tetratricopeptide (TPR) repeat protein